MLVVYSPPHPLYWVHISWHHFLAAMAELPVSSFPGYVENAASDDSPIPFDRTSLCPRRATRLEELRATGIVEQDSPRGRYKPNY